MIDRLESQFKHLERQILKELEHKKVLVSDFLRFLTLLPIAIRKEYKKSITDMFPELRRESNISDIFLHLNPLMDFLGFHLLECIIIEFGSNTIKKFMYEYSEKVLQFMKETTVKDLMDIWSAEHDAIPSSFFRLRAKIDKDAKTCTLYELEKLRRHFCGEVTLSHIVVILIGLEVANSFIVEWLIPSALVSQLMESIRNLDKRFFHCERIINIMVKNKEYTVPLGTVSCGKRWHMYSVRYMCGHLE